jgi:hypothetical protein
MVINPNLSARPASSHLAQFSTVFSQSLPQPFSGAQTSSPVNDSAGLVFWMSLTAQIHRSNEIFSNLESASTYSPVRDAAQANVGRALYEHEYQGPGTDIGDMATKPRNGFRRSLADPLTVTNRPTGNLDLAREVVNQARDNMLIQTGAAM